MLDLSFWEIIVIAVACLVFVKPEDVPEILRQMGKFFHKIKKTMHEFTSLLEIEEKQHNVKPRSKILGLDGKYHPAYDVNEVFSEEKTLQSPAEITDQDSEIKNG